MHVDVIFQLKLGKTSPHNSSSISCRERPHLEMIHLQIAQYNVGSFRSTMVLPVDIIFLHPCFPSLFKLATTEECRWQRVQIGGHSRRRTETSNKTVAVFMISIECLHLP